MGITSARGHDDGGQGRTGTDSLQSHCWVGYRDRLTGADSLALQPSTSRISARRACFQWCVALQRRRLSSCGAGPCHLDLVWGLGLGAWGRKGAQPAEGRSLDSPLPTATATTFTSLASPPPTLLHLGLCLPPTTQAHSSTSPTDSVLLAFRSTCALVASAPPSSLLLLLYAPLPSPRPASSTIPRRCLCLLPDDWSSGIALGLGSTHPLLAPADRLLSATSRCG